MSLVWYNLERVARRASNRERQGVTERIAGFIKEKATLLEEVGIEQARFEIELILCHLRNCERLDIYLDGLEAITDDMHKRLDDIIARRRTRYPLQFILNESWFYGRRFYVTPDVMAPTPETEMLCEHAIRLVQSRDFESPRILDIGVGSGVISVTLALELPSCRVMSLDISPAALKVAGENVARHAVTSRVELRESDLFAALKPEERFELIVSNPPYIAEPEYEGLDPEVKADPKVAMLGGPQGLDVIRRIVAEAPYHLAENGRIMFEIGCGQAESVARIVEQDGRYREFSILRDLNDRDRIIILALDSHDAA
jgi:release factor glutamine methyltransferase